ncbi:MAG: sugar phosphate isomerase/epimerase [Kiritimatiellae bacterium]|nr:sugar phosphate isomerase/epimerase [Kiritimatiellia bacterium]
MRKYIYALNTSTIRECGELSLEKKVQITAEAGYDGIEPWIKELDEYVEAGGNLRQLAALIKDSGLKTVNLIGFFEWDSPNDEIRRSGLEEAERCFKMAQELDCPYVAAPPFGTYQIEGVNLFDLAERYADLIDLGAKYNVIPVLEFWGVAKTLGKLGEALLVAAESGSKDACILADVFHMYKGSGHFNGLSLIDSSKIAILHVNDYPEKPEWDVIKDSDRVYPGDGIAPYDEIFEHLGENFSGVLSVELFNETYWQQDALVVAKTGLDKIKSIFEK